MPDVALVCQKLEPWDWPTLRRTRLAALADSPSAFAPREDERYWAPTQWQESLASATWVIARNGDDNVIGLAMSEPDQDDPRRLFLQSIWVLPPHRRQGVLRALIGDLIERAKRSDVRELGLWVLEDNHEAQDVYLRLGFQPSGLTGLAPQRLAAENSVAAAPRTELQMLLRLNR